MSCITIVINVTRVLNFDAVTKGTWININCQFVVDYSNKTILIFKQVGFTEQKMTF